MDPEVMQSVFRVLSDEELFILAENSPEYNAFHRGCQKLLRDLIKKHAFMTLLCNYKEEYFDIVDFSTQRLESNAQVMQKVFHVLSDEDVFYHAENSREYKDFHEGCEKLLHDLIQKPASKNKILREYEDEYFDILQFIQIDPESDAQDKNEKDQSRGQQEVTATGDAKGSVQEKGNMVETDSAHMTQTKEEIHIGTQNNEEKEKDKSRSQDVTATGDAKDSVQGERNMVGTDSAHMTQTKGTTHIETQNKNAPREKEIHVNVEKDNYGVLIAESKIQGARRVIITVEDNKSTDTGHDKSGGQISGSNNQ